MCSLLDNEIDPLFFHSIHYIDCKAIMFFFSLIGLEGVINKIVDMLGLQGSAQILRNLIFFFSRMMNVLICCFCSQINYPPHLRKMKGSLAWG